MNRLKMRPLLKDGVGKERNNPMKATRQKLVDMLVDYAADDYNHSQYTLIEVIVDDAIDEVRNARFPYGYTSESELAKQEDEVLTRYRQNVSRIAQYHYDKMGKEGVKTFYESGQTTTWENGGTPNSFFIGIIPVARCV